MRICVVGLGKIGLPLAAQYASKGFAVVGCDANPKVVKSVNAGKSYIKGEPELDEKVRDTVKRGLLSASTNTSKEAVSSDVVVVIVPLVVDDRKNIDYSAIDAATKDVAAGLQKKTLVIYETTLPIGDTRERIAPMLEESGLTAGKDFYLVYSPERVSSGILFSYLREIPKIVGGLNEASTRRGVEFYKKVLDSDVIPVKDCETAEAVKLFDMTYRDVNIALANEFAKFCQAKGIDIVEAIDAANTNPHSKILYPGAGVGGHCAPVYPYFLTEKAKDLGVELTLPEKARNINDKMPEYTVNLLEKELGGLSGKSVLLLGLAYRGGVKETRFSPSIAMIRKLKEEGAIVFLHDPLFTEKEIENYAKPTKPDALPKLDGVILATSHKEYTKLNAKKLKEKGVKTLIDGRNKLNRKKIEAAGITYIGIGRV